MKAELSSYSTKQRIDSPIKEIAKDIVYYIPARVIPALTGIAAVTIYTRLLTPEQYGLYILSIATISTTTSIAFDWLNRAILRYYEEYRQNEGLTEFISTIVLCLLGIVILVLFAWYIMVTFLENWLNHDLIILLRIGALVLLTQAGYTIILALKRAGRKSSKYAVYSILNALGKLGTAIILINFLHLGPRGILLGMAISAGGILLYELYRLYSRWPFHFSHFSKGLVGQLLTYGFPLTGVSIASLILASADRYMIGYFLGAADVGTYSASYTMSNMSVQFLASILMLAAYPVIIQNFERGGENSTRELLTKTTAMYIISLMPIAFGITALSKELGAIFLGQAFQGAYEIIPWVTWGAFCFGLTQYIYKPFELKKKTDILLYLVLIAAALSVILNLFFIPQFGILGASYSTLASYFVYLLGTWLAGRRLLMWSLPWKSFVKALIASLGMYAVLFFSKVGQSTNLGFLLLKVGLGAVVCFLTMCILREDTVLRGLRYLSEHIRVAGHHLRRDGTYSIKRFFD